MPTPGATFEHKTRLAKLEGDLEKNVAATYEHGVMLKEIATQDSKGRWIPGNFEKLTKENPEFKEQFGKAVHEVIPSPISPWGTLRISNQMLTWQYLDVNGIGHWVGPQSYLDVIVPAGWTTTQLAGYEPAKNWWLGRRIISSR